MWWWEGHTENWIHLIYIYKNIKARGGVRVKILILPRLKYAVALPFLISEWAGFLQSARRFKSYGRFRKEGHEGRKPIFLDFPYVLYKPKWGQKSPKNGHF